MNKESITEFLIIGAGVAGATAARLLCDQGHAVRVVEAAPHVGGRLFAKRLSVTCGADLSFDIGAQFLRVMDPAMQALAAQATDDGALRPLPDLMQLRNGLWLDGDKAERWRGHPHMASFVEWLLRDVPVTLSCPVNAVRREGEGWVVDGDKARFQARHVILALPPQQAASLWPGFLDQAGMAKLAPCWSLSIGFDQKLSLQSDAVAVEGDVLAWIARQPALRDGERFGRDRIVLHAAAEWSQAQRHATPQAVQAAMLDALQQNLGPLPPIGFAEAVFWPHAKVTQPAAKPCLQDESGALVAVGDWCIGPRIEAAMLSAKAGVGALLRR